MRPAATTPAARLLSDPINVYHCHDTRLISHTAVITAAATATPANAACSFTFRVNVPRKNTPRIMPLVNDAIASTSVTTLCEIRIAASATPICTTPHTTVSVRDTLR